jgi:hypothetical protein
MRATIPHQFRSGMLTEKCERFDQDANKASDYCPRVFSMGVNPFATAKSVGIMERWRTIQDAGESWAVTR